MQHLDIINYIWIKAIDTSDDYAWNQRLQNNKNINKYDIPLNKIMVMNQMYSKLIRRNSTLFQVPDEAMDEG